MVWPCCKSGLFALWFMQSQKQRVFVLIKLSTHFNYSLHRQLPTFFSAGMSYKTYLKTSITRCSYAKQEWVRQVYRFLPSQGWREYRRLWMLSLLSKLFIYFFFFFHLKGFKSVFHIFLFFFSIKRSPQWPLVVSVTRSLGCDPNVLQDLMGKGREGGKVRYLMVGIFR